MRKFFLLFSIVLLAAFNVQAQYYLSGQDPASLHWNQINTKHFRLVFPEHYRFKAQVLANMVEHSYPEVSNDLNSRKIKSDLIMHTSGVISNATVAWAPRRLDFYNTPSQDGYPQEWFRQLSIHELRHIAQINRLDADFGKGLSFLFGQQGTAAILGIFIPNWFLEGDAVVVETSLSHSGRGRQPLFEAGLRAQLLEQGLFTYDKAYFGSYRHHVPDIYELGYFLVGYNKQKYGNEIWENALDLTARKPYILNPFSKALKEVSGLGKGQLYRETVKALQKEWLLQDSLTVSSSPSLISPAAHIFTSYRFPQKIRNGGFVATRTSLDDIGRIVLIENNKEKVLFTPGSMFNQSLSATDSLVVWNEYQPDLRWSNQNFSVIKIGDIKHGNIRQLTSKSRFFAPDISNDNNKIAVSETDEYGTYSLVVLYVQDGMELFRFSSDSLFFQTPKWLNDNIHLVSTVVGKAGKGMLKVNTITGESEMLIPYGYTDFSISSVEGDKVLLQGSWSGISNIFSFDLKTNAIQQLTSSRFGATDAVFDSSMNRLIYADYNSDGYRLVALSKEKLLRLPADEVKNFSFDLPSKLAKNERFNIDETIFPDSVYFVRKYSKMAHLFNIHSWSPFYLEADNQQVKPGFSLMSQNTLSTMVSEVGYRYDMNEQTGKTVVKFSYLGLFPVIEGSFGTGLRRGIGKVDSLEYDRKWHETDWNVGFRIPFNLTKDRWIRGIQPSVSFSQLYRKMVPEVGLSFREDFSSTIIYSLYAWNQSRAATRDLYPKWGQTFQIVFRHSPFDLSPSQQFFASTNLFFPGLGKHHGFRLYASMQAEKEGFYSYGNLASVPRGYSNLFFNDFYVIKGDYVFPLFYPELNLPTVFYLQRVRAGIFYDFISGTGIHAAKTYSSAGVELNSDWYFFNFPAPVNIGLRLSNTFTENNWVPELIFGINFSSLY
ncbi:MAG: hypothetical protein CVT92_10600 [Bacteroidetes bacterium HGW-Bacteroidetes-1]|jgi:hypothetical protein|nr:MAG: hypothetical protein CVT92_10600 [Bacteroidetes bacterium HGW-Bacteroidetes-1]